MMRPYAMPAPWYTNQPMANEPVEPGTTVKPAAGQTASAAAASDAVSVAISGMSFGAPTVTIKAGGTVTWTNNSTMPHTVTAIDGSYGSGQLDNGASFSHTYDQPGTYSYYCKLHPRMRGQVIVVDG
jgi:amicyanin